MILFKSMTGESSLRKRALESSLVVTNNRAVINGNRSFLFEKAESERGIREKGLVLEISLTKRDLFPEIDEMLEATE